MELILKKTLVSLNTVPAEGNIAIIGFYGDRLIVQTVKELI